MLCFNLFQGIIVFGFWQSFFPFLEINFIYLFEACHKKTDSLDLCKHKGSDQLRSVFVFAMRIEQFLCFLNPKFPTVLVQLGLCQLRLICCYPVHIRYVEPMFDLPNLLTAIALLESAEGDKYCKFGSVRKY